MKIEIDTASGTLSFSDASQIRSMPLYSDEAFEILSHWWLKVGWNQKYPYCFSWMGRPIIQLPEDIIRVQEVIYRVKPDVIIETGVAHGGSLILYASLFRAIGKGRVVGIDIEIRPHNRDAIQSHELSSYITLIEGGSTDPTVVKKAKGLVKAGETVMVILDSNHSKQHVQDELELYHDVVTPGSYIVATDGSMKDLHDVPRGKTDWRWDNPADAAAEFVVRHPDFRIVQPVWPFNESTLSNNITHWPNAWLQRIS
jgi:cephalosporin hydroxylase